MPALCRPPTWNVVIRTGPAAAEEGPAIIAFRNKFPQVPVVVAILACLHILPGHADLRDQRDLQQMAGTSAIRGDLPGTKDLRRLVLDSCRPLEDRLSAARKLLSAVPPATSLEIIPHAVKVWFRTNAAGVGIPPRLRSDYPTDMVIILENQYRDLIVTAESITVTVSFKGVWETLVIPLDTLIMVSDETAGIDIDLRKCR